MAGEHSPEEKTIKQKKYLAFLKQAEVNKRLSQEAGP